MGNGESHGIRGMGLVVETRQIEEVEGKGSICNEWADVRGKEEGDEWMESHGI